MRGNVVQPPILTEGLAAAARHGAVVNDKARQLVAHLLREGAVREEGRLDDIAAHIRPGDLLVGGLAYSVTVRQRVQHLAPACHRFIDLGAATAAANTAFGAERCKARYMWVGAKQDNAHQQNAGACRTAQAFVQQFLQDTTPALDVLRANFK